MQIKNNQLILGGIPTEELIQKFQSPLYIYEKEVILERFQKLHDSITVPQKKILYAIKANSNLEIAKIFKEKQCGIDAVSPGEIALALKAGFNAKDILFTGNNMTDSEMEYAVEKGVLLNIGSLSRLEKFGQKFPNREICIRINPDVEANIHKHVITAGPQSKFGINYNQTQATKEILEKYQLKLIGIHSHIGSGILESEKFLLAMRITLDVAKHFKNLEFIDFGGGLGIPYKPTEKALDLDNFGKEISGYFNEFCKEYGNALTLILEPGRFFVAESGFLLTEVNTIKYNKNRKFAGTDSGFNHLIRPAMYSAYHPIYNASNLNGKKEILDICGNLCESGDLFARDREINEIREGDILAIAHAGAYGFSMASNYNTRPLPAEIMVADGKATIIRQRQTIEDII